MDERKQLAADLGPHMALILRNHGLLTVGRTVGESMVVMVTLEQAIGTQLRAMATGAELLVPDEMILDLTARNRDGMNERTNARNWLTLMNLADRLDPSYRE